MRWRVEPRFGYGSRPHRIDMRAGVPVASAGADALAVRAWNAGSAICDADAISGEFVASTGSRALLVLSASHAEPLVFPARAEAEARLDSTIDFWRELGRQPLLRRPVARCRHSQRLGAEALGPRTIRRNRRRRHDLPARDARRRAQLGLPLLVAPRLRFHARCLPRARLFAGSRRLLLVAVARVSTHPSPPPGPLPPRRWHARA